MKTNKEIKKDIVSEIENNLNNANSLIVYRYHELNSNDIAKLRIEVKKNEDVNKIYKNRLFKVALKNANKEELIDELVGPNAFLFLNSEDQTSLKTLNKFIAENDALEFVGGYIEDKYYNGEEIQQIANLPSKPEMISMLLSVLQAPMRNAAYAISQIKNDSNE